MTDNEMVEMYRGYMFHIDSCITEERVSRKRLKNVDSLYRLMFESSCVTLVELEQAASQYANTVAKRLFEAMFKTDADRLIFCFKCAPSLPVWVQNGNNRLFGSLEVNGVETIDDKPMRIFVMDEQVQLMWGYKHVPDRDPTFGPAIVEINADKSFVGHHVTGGANVDGLPNWQEQCAQHNLWIAHLLR